MAPVALVRLGSKSVSTIVRVASRVNPSVVNVGGSSSVDAITIEDNSDEPFAVPVETTDPVQISVSTGYPAFPGERWWSGEGDPPELIVGARVGDFYWNVVSGDVFELMA